MISSTILIVERKRTTRQYLEETGLRGAKIARTMQYSLAGHVVVSVMFGYYHFGMVRMRQVRRALRRTLDSRKWEDVRFVPSTPLSL